MNKKLVKTLSSFAKTLGLSVDPKMGVIYGTGVYEKGKVLNTPAMAQAYEMGKNV